MAVQGIDEEERKFDDLDNLAFEIPTAGPKPDQ